MDDLSFLRVPAINFVGKGPSRPVGIEDQIGRRPSPPSVTPTATLRCCCGRPGGRGARLAAIVHHTDSAREYGYDRTADLGRLDKVLDHAADNCWTVIDMRDD